MLQLLHRNGPATSTSVARALGQNTGTTSYHRRQLAEHGFIEEVPDRGRGRERWWRVRERDIRFTPRSRMDVEMRAAFDEFGRQGVAADFDAFERFQAQREEMGEWGDAWPSTTATPPRPSRPPRTPAGCWCGSSPSPRWSSHYWDRWCIR